MSWRSLRTTLAALLVLAAAARPVVLLAASGNYCSAGQTPAFADGFADLHTQVGSAMGKPTDCQHVDASSGDTVQTTTTGLAAYDPATNTPSFTNGFKHWALTDDGLQTWTGDSANPPPPPPPAPTPTPDPYCDPGESPAFSNGIASLAAQLGNAMGDPVECEHANAANGNTVQQTTTGLAYYLASSNTPSFTDGWQHYALMQGRVVQWGGTQDAAPASALAPAPTLAPTATIDNASSTADSVSSASAAPSADESLVSDPSPLAAQAQTKPQGSTGSKTSAVSAASAPAAAPAAPPPAPQTWENATPVDDTGPIVTASTGAGAARDFAPGRDPSAQLQTRSLPDGSIWLGVPFASQLDDPSQTFPDASAAALTMVLNSLGVNATTQDVGSSLGAPIPTTLPQQLAAVAQQYGLVATSQPVSNGGWTVDQVEQQLQAQHPVIILVPDGGSAALNTATGQHAVVLMGLDADGVIYNDGTFATTYGYGLQLSFADLQADLAAQSGSAPVAAVAFALPAPNAAASTSESPSPAFQPMQAEAAVDAPASVRAASPSAPAMLPVVSMPESASPSGPAGLRQSLPLLIVGLLTLLASAIAASLKLGWLASLAGARRPRPLNLVSGRARQVLALAAGMFALALVVASFVPALPARAATAYSDQLPTWVQSRVATSLWDDPTATGDAHRLAVLPGWSFLRVRSLQGNRVLVEYAGDGQLSHPGLGWVAVENVQPSDAGGVWLTATRATTLYADASQPSGSAVPQNALMVQLAPAGPQGRVSVRVYSPQLNQVVGQGWVPAADVALAPSPQQSVFTQQVSFILPSAPTSNNAFIQTIAPLAQASAKQTGVPASVTISQAILESDWGNSLLSREANNYFGIKAMGTVGSAGAIWMPTQEYENGQLVTIQDAFRAYTSLADSIADHSALLKTLPRYANAFQVSSDPIQFAQRIATDGYSTDPQYAAKLAQLMNAYNLYQYDR